MKHEVFCKQCKQYVDQKDFNSALGLCNNYIKENENNLKDYSKKQKSKSIKRKL